MCVCVCPHKRMLQKPQTHIEGACWEGKPCPAARTMRTSGFCTPSNLAPVARPPTAEPWGGSQTSTFWDAGSETNI